ncbi:MAG TPA: porin family protein [Lutibacter sp.]|nr:porin family protein [Lutibacter sp.]
MKKIILVAFIAISSFVGVNAQTSFGAKAGLNVANLSGDITDNKTLIGFNVGVFAEIMLADSFYLQPELLYSTQGAKFDESTSGFSADLNLNYINIPLMFKYDVANRFYLEAGPQIGFLVSAEVLDQDVKDEFESTDFGANFGLSYGFTEKLFAQARYNIGLSNIAKDSGDDKISNSVISFSLGYKF